MRVMVVAGACRVWRHFSSHFLLTAAQEQTTGDQFLHMFIEDGSPVARLGCGRGLVLNAAAEQNIDNGRWMSITVRYDEFNWLQLRCAVIGDRYVHQKQSRPLSQSRRVSRKSKAAGSFYLIKLLTTEKQMCQPWTSEQSRKKLQNQEISSP